ncbi:hypothetical protein [Streptomyces spiramenti]|uniref:Secreted protein n=1 Tax=Streptomyces spiramenti TaxID=2720606 RepID=A0ABX1ACL6_9ACTN|nr:hypothetical protein [Streptomyces spiramenti]NJP64944.1 hypothetical protein [Streptomyces spiramenti]
MHESTSRTSELRTTAVASAVALALALPLAFAKDDAQHSDDLHASPPAATGTDGEAGTDGNGDEVADGGEGDRAEAGAAETEVDQGGTAPGRGDEGAQPSGPKSAPGGKATESPADRHADPTDRPGATEAECGPAMSAPRGVEARTCVVTEGTDTWARVYYRNGSGEPLRGELTVRDPGGGSVEVHCDVPATEARGICETPRAPTVDDSTAARYSATAELAAPGTDSTLLRAATPGP